MQHTSQSTCSDPRICFDRTLKMWSQAESNIKNLEQQIHFVLLAVLPRSSKIIKLIKLREAPLSRRTSRTESSGKDWSVLNSIRKQEGTSIGSKMVLARWGGTMKVLPVFMVSILRCDFEKLTKASFYSDFIRCCTTKAENVCEQLLPVHSWLNCGLECHKNINILELGPSLAGSVIVTLLRMWWASLILVMPGRESKWARWTRRSSQWALSRGIGVGLIRSPQRWLGKSILLSEEEHETKLL